MSQVRVNFLNWRPDADEFGNNGLTAADNVVHDTEGWKPIFMKTAGALSTTAPLAAATISALMVKSIGSVGDKLVAWITGDTLHVGVNGATSTSSVTGYPPSFATAGGNRNITMFDVCEPPGGIFFTVEAEQSVSAPSVTSQALRFNGYIAL